MGRGFSSCVVCLRSRDRSSRTCHARPGSHGNANDYDNRDANRHTDIAANVNSDAYVYATPDLHAVPNEFAATTAASD